MNEPSFIEGTGPAEYLAGFDNSGPEYVKGEHRWIAVVIYDIDPEDVKKPRMVFRGDMVLQISPVICYWCEEKYSPSAASVPCTGDENG